MSDRHGQVEPLKSVAPPRLGPPSKATMSDTPSTEQIRDWCEGYGPDWGVFSEENVQQGLAFDRWLAAHDRKVRAEALREAADSAAEEPYLTVMRGDIARWLRERAENANGGQR